MSGISKDIISLAQGGKVSDFTSHINDMMNQRAFAAIDTRKVDMARTMFSAAVEESEAADAEDNIVVSDQEIDDLLNDTEED